MTIYVVDFEMGDNVGASPPPAAVMVGIRLGGSIPNRAG